MQDRSEWVMIGASAMASDKENRGCPDAILKSCIQKKGDGDPFHVYCHQDVGT